MKAKTEECILYCETKDQLSDRCWVFAEIPSCYIEATGVLHFARFAGKSPEGEFMEVGVRLDEIITYELRVQRK